MQQLLVDVTGRSFPDVMRTEVLQPLAMTRSTYDQPLPQHLTGNAASGHNPQGAVIKGKWYTHPEMAAAGLWTSPSDLARYAIEVQLSAAGKSNRVLKQPMAAQMLTRQTGTWGLGPSLDGEGPNASFSHGGANQGFRVFFTAFNERGQGAVVMTNSDAGSPLLSEIVRAIAEEYGWPTPRIVEKAVVEVKADKLTPLAGRYSLEVAPSTFITSRSVMRRTPVARRVGGTNPTSPETGAGSVGGSSVRLCLTVSGRGRAAEDEHGLAAHGPPLEGGAGA